MTDEEAKERLARLIDPESWGAGFKIDPVLHDAAIHAIQRIDDAAQMRQALEDARRWIVNMNPDDKYTKEILVTVDKALEASQ